MEVSVYDSLTRLCENVLYDKKNPNKTPSSEHIKRLRTKCYEILLSKNLIKKPGFQRLQNIDDVECNLLAWQLHLITEKGLPEHAMKLSNCINKLEDMNVFHNEQYQSILNLLLDLQTEPNKTNTKLLDVNLDRWNVNGRNTFDGNKFKLPINLKETFLPTDVGWRLQGKFKELDTYNNHQGEMCPRAICEQNQIDEKVKEEEELDIWEEVLKAPTSKHKIWENLGCPREEKELPFLSEAKSEVTNWLNAVSSFYILDSTSVSTKTVTLSEFVVDIKHLLVGIQSRSFVYKDGDLQLASDVSVRGLSPGALRNFTSDLLVCFASYKGLHKLSTPNLCTGKYEKDGYIFTELCDSISRYLSFYRIAVMSMPDTTNLLTLHYTIKKLSVQIKTLASICKVGPYEKYGNISHGISLLNYLYQEVTTHTNKDVLMVLYAIFYPCYQVYFNRFLQQWILGGCISDPYEEFFIHINNKYLTTHGRTFWTRTYNSQANLVPDFLNELQNDILHCGKSMNLLKLCVPSAPLCLYVMGKTPCIFSCCLTREQLLVIEKNSQRFYLEVCNVFGQRLSLKELIERNKDSSELATLATKKRVATIKRINLQRKMKADQEYERKKELMNALREQHLQALYDKQVNVIAQLEEELEMLEKETAVKEMREKLLDEEARNLIDYYTSLCATAEKRRNDIVKSMEKSKNLTLELPITSMSKTESESSLTSSIYHEALSNLSIPDDRETIEEIIENPPVSNLVEIEIEKQPPQQVAEHIITNLDAINANTQNDNKKDVNFNLSTVHFETLQEAQRNKLKILSSEFNLNEPIKLDNYNRPLSDLQKNKNKNLSSNFNSFTPIETNKTRLESALEKNRSKIMGVNSCFQYERIDIENKNLKNREKQMQLSLTLNFDLNKPISIETELASSSSITTPTPFLSEPCTCSTSSDYFELDKSQIEFYKIPIGFNEVFSKRVKANITSSISNTCLDIFLKQGIAIPLTTQMKLVNNELLHYFIHKLNYLNHLNSLRNYFFLLDGEFSHLITENLFKKLYDVNLPEELVNYRTLHMLAYNTLDSTTFQENSEFLSFKINSMPKVFNLSDPDVLDCISLTYKVSWPLNILLPSDTISKYDIVFKFLLKLERVFWVTQRIFYDLKLLVKQTESNKVGNLMICPQYRALHQYRHFMSHFILTLRNYIVGEVLQSSWEMFESKLSFITNIDQLYTLHTDYIKNILFMCLLNQRAAPLRKSINKILIVILKFYDYFRSRLWDEEDGVFTHPNFLKLISIYNNFKELIQHFFKVGHKVVQSGYQPHLLQLLDMLDLNGFYTKEIVNK